MVVCSPQDPSLNQQDLLALKVLRAAEYGALVRLVLMRDSRQKPELLKTVPACAKLAQVTPETIERFLLPHFHRHVSENHAQEALRFWGSAHGSAIKRKLLAGIAEGDATVLSSEENALLQAFNESGAGLAMGRLAQDPTACREIIRSIGEFKA